MYIIYIRIYVYRIYSIYIYIYMYVYCLSFRHLGRILTHLYIDMCVCMYMAHRVSFYFGVHQRGACWSILMHSVSSIAALSQHPFFMLMGSLSANVCQMKSAFRSRVGIWILYTLKPEAHVSSNPQSLLSRNSLLMRFCKSLCSGV